MRLLLHSPKDTVAGAVSCVAVMAIIVNAMFLQSGRHPSPMFGGDVVVLQPAAVSPAMRAGTPVPPVAAPAGPLPRPRPPHADRRSDMAPAEALPAQPVALRQAGPQAGPQADPIGHLVRTVAARGPEPVRETDGETAPSGRIAAVQRVLSDYGYGQLKPTGQLGPETRAAIRKFELARHLPVTGQMSERLASELAAMTGRRID